MSATPASDPSRLVIVIDDDDLVRPVVNKALSRQGYEITEAASFELAMGIDEDTRRRAGLVLCDATLAGLDKERLHSDFGPPERAGCVVLMSGFSPDHLLSKGIPVQKDHFLQKPWSIRQLVDCVDRYFEGG